MMAAILNSAMLDWDTAILDSDTIFSQIYSKTLYPLWLWLKLIQSLKLIHTNLMMAGILNSTIWPSWIQIMVKITQQDWFPTFAQKNSTNSIWLNLMLAAMLNSTMLDWDTAILDSDTLLSSLRFTQKHSHSTLMLTQTNSIWLKLIHSHLTWWWQPSWILPSWIPPS